MLNVLKKIIQGQVPSNAPSYQYTNMCYIFVMFFIYFYIIDFTKKKMKFSFNLGIYYVECYVTQKKNL